jgi:hypothetical protein
VLRFAVESTAICIAPPFSGALIALSANPIPATEKYCKWIRNDQLPHDRNITENQTWNSNCDQ